MNQNARRYYQAVNSLSPRLRVPLHAIPETLAQSVQEVRLRLGAPLSVHTGREHYFFGTDGLPTRGLPNHPFLVTKVDLSETFRLLCEYSLHTHQHEVANGFVSVAGGHRAGVCGIVSGGGLREVHSINLRVAREIIGVATNLCGRLFSDGPCGVIIAGAPGSGKTTVLRDIARSLSSGEWGTYYKVSVVDERYELSAGGGEQMNLGPCTDLLCGYQKSSGIEIAVRTLSPQFVVCDEIGHLEELAAVRTGTFSGTEIITTAHCKSPDELHTRPILRELIATGAFSRLVFLKGQATPGQVQEIVGKEELAVC